MHSRTQRFFLNILVTTLPILLVLAPGTLKAQDDAEVITQFRRTVFKLQQEMLELKNQIDSQGRELRAQKEELGLQVERLNQENAKMRKHLLEMDSLMLQMEDRLASSSLVKLSKQLENLRNFNKAMIMDNIGGSDQSEKILLDILNQPETSLPKDLLVLLLAQQKKRLQLYDESISYYSTLLAEFSNSIYFSQAIFEMAEVFGETDKKEQQLTLLAQLSSLSETDPFSKKAQEKLKELGADELFEEAAIKPDATADASSEEIELAAIDATADGKIAEDDKIMTDATGDATTDTAPITVAEETTDSGSEDTTSDTEQTISDSKAATAPEQAIDATSDSAGAVSDQAVSDSTADSKENEASAIEEEQPETTESAAIEEEKPAPEPDYDPGNQQPEQAE